MWSNLLATVKMSACFSFVSRISPLCYVSTPNYNIHLCDLYMNVLLSASLDVILIYLTPFNNADLKWGHHFLSRSKNKTEKETCSYFYKKTIHRMRKNSCRIKNSCKSIKNRQSNDKLAKGLNRHLSREDIQMLYKYMKDVQFHWPLGKCKLKPHTQKNG